MFLARLLNIANRNAMRISNLQNFTTSIIKSMALCKTAVTPLPTHWSHCSLALNHRSVSMTGPSITHYYYILQGIIPVPAVSQGKTKLHLRNSHYSPSFRYPNSKHGKDPTSKRDFSFIFSTVGDAGLFNTSQRNTYALPGISDMLLAFYFWK